MAQRRRPRPYAGVRITPRGPRPYAGIRVAGPIGFIAILIWIAIEAAHRH